MLRIELLIDARAELGEGPLWDVAEQRLYWIDSLGAKVHSCDTRAMREHGACPNISARLLSERAAERLCR